MIVFSRGWGLLVPVSVMFGFFTGAAAAGLLGLEGGKDSLVMWLVTAVVCWGCLGLAVRKLEAEPTSELVDEATGRRLRVGRDAGSFFFIPTRKWLWIAPGLAVVMAFASMST